MATSDQIRALEAENATLRAKIASARADGAWDATVRQARKLTPQEWENVRLGMISYLSHKATEAGFNGSTEAGREAYRVAYDLELRARLRAEAAESPEARARVIKYMGAAYLEPDAASITSSLDGTTIQATIGVERRPAPPASDDPLAVYLPPPTVATPAAIERAVAIAEGRLVELPTDPVARAIIAADRKARGESEPGSKPL